MAAINLVHIAYSCTTCIEIAFTRDKIPMDSRERYFGVKSINFNLIINLMFRIGWVWLDVTLRTTLCHVYLRLQRRIRKLESTDLFGLMCVSVALSMCVNRRMLPIK